MNEIILKEDYAEIIIKSKKYGVFKRPQKVWCTYTDENGKEKEIADGGFVSRVISHECDHLERRLFSFSYR